MPIFVLRITLLLTFLCNTAFAADLADQASPANTDEHIEKTDSPPTDVTTLAPVTVFGQPEDPLTGVSALSHETLDLLPQRNGSVNEAISILPGIQLTEEARSSLTGGEILPPLLSISGGKAYQNNFLVDGISNNSLIHPLSDSPININGVPDHPERLFLSTQLVDQIDVYRYNIPASFGHFSGGVIEVETIDPGPAFFGEVNYRTTRSSWTEFFVDSEQQEEFDNSNSYKRQPEFEKHFGGILLNTPLTDQLSLLTSYQLSYSRLPLINLGEEKVQTRRNENFLAKLAYTPDTSSQLITSVHYAPYEGEYFYSDAKNGSYSIKGGGLQLSSEYERSFERGDLILFGTWQQSKNEREAEASALMPWLAEIDSNPATLTIEPIPSSKPWGLDVGTTSSRMPSSYEGSIGSLENEQQGFQLKSDFVTQPIATGEGLHTLSFGVDFEQAAGSMEREEAYYNYFLNNASVDTDGNPDTPTERISYNDDYPDLVCPIGSKDCIDGEQLFLKRQTYDVDSASATINLFDLYLEDRFEWQRLKVRPGLRISYDDFMENTNLAPRLALSFDLFGDDRSVLIGGLNRYYGRTLLGYKLREASKPWYYQEREVTTDEFDNVVPGEWVDGYQFTTAYRYTKLDTPFTDEIALGLDQNLWGGRLKLAWIHRKGREEFSQEKTAIQPDGYRYYQLANNGESRHEEYSLEWARSWRNHALMLNVVYQESETTNEEYDETYDLADTEEIVWFEGRLIHRDNLPRDDFNQPWIANLTYTARLPWNLTFTNVTTYRSGYEGLVALSSAEKTAHDVPTKYAYKTEDLPESWLFNWFLRWEKMLVNSHILSLTLEVDNVFNQRIESGDPISTTASSINSYELGRQFWLGVEYAF